MESQGTELIHTVCVCLCVCMLVYVSVYVCLCVCFCVCVCVCVCVSVCKMIPVLACGFDGSLPAKILSEETPFIGQIDAL